MNPYRRTALAVIVAMAMLTPLLSAWAHAQGPIANGEMATGQIFPAGDADTWTFFANAGDAIVVRAGRAGLPGGLWPRLRMFGPGGSQVGPDSGPSIAELRARTTITGTYSIVVDDGSNTSTGTGGYRLTLAKTGAPVGVSPGDEGGPMANGVLHTGTIELGDLDVWTVNANAGDVIIARMGEGVPGSGLWPWLRIYGPTGAPGANNAAPGATEVTAIASVSGTYLILASDYGVDSTGTGPYRLTLAKTGAPVGVSPGDEGGPMANGVLHTGTIELGDLDLWTVDVTAGARILLTMEDMRPGGDALWPLLRVYDPIGGQFSEQSGPSYAQVNGVATMSGTYLIVAGDGNGGLAATGPYRITLGTTLDTPQAPVTFELAFAPPSPNPFAGRTRLHFTLPVAGRAALRVFDVQGRLVRTLVDEPAASAGEHDAVWDGRDDAGEPLHPGMYLARLDTTGPALLRKLTLSR